MQQNKKETAAPLSLPDALARSTLHRDLELHEVLSEDVTGTIYAAKKPFRGKAVAVNVLAPGCSIESKRLIAVDHPNICRAFKLLKMKDGTVAIVLERPLGRPILELIGGEERKERFGVPQCISAILQLLSALHAVHQAGETARNLNVNNVFLHRDRKQNLHLKLVSLGIGGTGVNMKAPHYLSPERIVDADKGDVRSDIWAAGAVFYHLCFGRPPFGSGDAYEVARRNLLEAPSFEVGGSVPESLVAVIKRALERDEGKRYQSVPEMVGDLLPLREAYNEPMGGEVAQALKKSYPPPPHEGLAPKKPLRGRTMSMPALPPALSSKKQKKRGDDTAEYGERKRARQPAAKPLFNAAKIAASVAKKDPPPRQVKADANKTLLGMPALDTRGEELDLGAAAGARDGAHEQRRPAAPSAVDKRSEHGPPKRTAAASGEFFSARSILGSEEDIKQLEEEMGSLEADDDGDVPTLVANSQTFSALVAEAKAMGQAPAPSAPLGQDAAASERDEPLPDDGAGDGASPGEEPREAAEPGAAVAPAPAMIVTWIAAVLGSRRRQRRIGAGVAALVALVALVAALSGGGSPPAEPEQLAEKAALAQGAFSAEPMADVPSPSTDVPGEDRVAVLSGGADEGSLSGDDAAPPREDDGARGDGAGEERGDTAGEVEAAAAAGAAKAVSISFIGLPTGATVKHKGKQVALPLEREPSSMPITLTITAPGYKSYTQQVTLDNSKEITVEMVKAEVRKPAPKPKSKPRSKRTRPKAGKKKGPLVSNPFKS